MSFPSAFKGEMYRTSVRSWRSPANALRTSRSMQARNAASVLPDPVGAEIRVVRPARMCGQPCSWGSVGVPNRRTNHSLTSGCAHSSDSIGEDREGRDILLFYRESHIFANCSPVYLPQFSAFWQP